MGRSKHSIFVLALILVLVNFLPLTIAMHDSPGYLYDWPSDTSSKSPPDTDPTPPLPQHIIVEAGGPYQNLTGRTIHFSGNAWPSSQGGYLVSYIWNFGDGTSYIGNFTHPSNEPDNVDKHGNTVVYPDGSYACPANHTYSQDGYYVATLTVYDSRGNSASDSALVAINKPLPDIDYPEWAPDWWKGGESLESIFSKKVKDPSTSLWVENAPFHIGEHITFRVKFSVNVDGGAKGIVITDYLPPTVRYLGASITPYSIERIVYFDNKSFSFYPFTKLTWRLGNKPKGTEITIYINGRVERLGHSYFNIPSDYNFIPIVYTTKNTAICKYRYTAYSSGCGNPYTRTATLKNAATFSIVSEEPHLTLVKEVKIDPTSLWHDNVTVNAGDTVRFRLIIDNSGDLPIEGLIFVTDCLPEGLEYIDGSADYKIYHGDIITPPIPKEPTIKENYLKWVFNESLDIDSGIIVEFDVIAKRSGFHVNLGAVRARYNNIPLYDEDTATVNVKAAEEPRVCIEKKVWNGEAWDETVTVAVGEKVKFKILVANEGNVRLTNLTVKDTLPGFLKFADPTPHPYPDNYVTWHIPYLDTGTSTEIVFNATAISVGAGKNVANVTCDQDVTDEDTAEVTVTCMQISVEKYVSKDNKSWDKSVEVFVGEKAYYMILIRNRGGVDLHNITVSDSIGWLTFLQLNESHPHYDYIHNGYYIWNISHLSPNEDYHIYYSVDTLSYGGPSCNVVFVETEEGVNDSSCASITVKLKPTTKIDVEKYVSVDGIHWNKSAKVHVGETVSFRIVVRNNGTTKLDIVFVNDTIPPFLEFIYDSFVPAYPEIAGDTVKWVLEDLLPKNECAEILFNATAICCGEGDNLVEVCGINGTNDVHDTDIAEIKVICADIEVTKMPNVTEAKIGDIVNYTITVRNTGIDPLYNVWVNDTTLEINEYVGTLDGGESYSFHVEHQITIDDPDPFINEVFAEGRDELGTVYTSSDEATVDIIKQLNFTLEKYVKWDCESYKKEINLTTDQIQQDPRVIFKIYVNNTGETPLDFYIRDDLPDGLVYNYSVSYEPEVSGNHLYWNFTDVEPNKKLILEFFADITACGNFTNIVHVIAKYNSNEMERENYAIVRTPPCVCNPSIKIDKKVWDESIGEWVDCITIEEKYRPLRFNITVENDGTCDIYNLTIADKLGCVLYNPRDFYESDENLSRSLNNDHRLIIWNLNRIFYPGERIYIEFTATVHLEVGQTTYNRAYAMGDTEEGSVKYNDTTNIYCAEGEPELVYQPTHIKIVDTVYRGETISTSFELWNGGTGVLIFNITGYPSYVSVYPQNGTSNNSLDRKLININISTTTLYVGVHSIEIPIQSNGGYGIFYVNFTLTTPPELSYYPTTISFGDVEKGKIVTKTLNVWNSGGEVLSYTITTNCTWLVIDRDSGQSSGEIDTINLTIDTSHLDLGFHECSIEIDSNGGSGTVTIDINIIPPLQPPNVSIEKPIDGAIYLWNKEIFRFFRTIIIGPIAIEVNATDPDGNIEKVEFFIDNTSVYNDTEAPYAYALNDRMFGRHTIKVVAYDDQGLSSEASVEAFIISFGIRTVEIE